VYVPFIKQDEPLKLEMRHFVECIKEGIQPITGGPEGLEVVRILEASSLSLKQGGASVPLRPLNGKNVNGSDNVNGEAAVEKPADGKLITA
jgi:hypothetical protein